MRKGEIEAIGRNAFERSKVPAEDARKIVETVLGPQFDEEAPLGDQLTPIRHKISLIIEALRNWKDVLYVTEAHSRAEYAWRKSPEAVPTSARQKPQ